MLSQQGVTLVLARWITALSAQRAIATRGHTQTCALPAVHALSCFTEVPVEAIHRGIRGKLRQRRDRRLITKRKSAHPFRLTRGPSSSGTVLLGKRRFCPSLPLCTIYELNLTFLLRPRLALGVKTSALVAR